MKYFQLNGNIATLIIIITCQQKIDITFLCINSQ